MTTNDVSDTALARLAVNLVDAGIFAVDRTLTIVLWNDFMAHHSGVPASDALGKPLFDLFPELPRHWMEKKFQRVFMLKSTSFTAAEQRPWLFQFPHNRPLTGGIDSMQQNTRFIPVIGSDGTVSHVCVCVFDVTDTVIYHRQLQRVVEQLEVEKREQQALIDRLAEAQEQLIQSEKLAAIGQLAAGVAHEINNPVGFVMSNFRSLERYLSGAFELLNTFDAHAHTLPAETQAQIERMKTAMDYEFVAEDVAGLLEESRDGLERVKRIVSDLRDFSRVGESDWQWANVHTCLESTLNVVMNEIKYKAEVIRDYGDIPDIECMPFQLNQVFLNLFVNAAQAIVGHGTITVRTRLRPDGVGIEIEDTGSGMSPETMRRIFDPFFTTKPVGQGTGLGLSVTHSIVGRHGGHIEVSSEVDKGTCFRVWLPLNQAQRQQQVEAA